MRQPFTVDMWSRVRKLKRAAAPDAAKVRLYEPSGPPHTLSWTQVEHPAFHVPGGTMLKLTDNERLALKYIATPPSGAPSLPPAVMEIAPALAEMG